MGRKGGFDKLLDEAVGLCNNTTSRIHGFRPSDAVGQKASVLSLKFNKRRQAPGKQLAPRIKKGDWVLVTDKAKKSDLFYKSYRDHFSVPKQVSARKGHGYIVGGKSYPRDRLKKVPQKADEKSIALLRARQAPKRPSLEERKAKAKTRQAKRELEKAAYTAQPRRSGRASVMKVHLK